MLFSKAIQIKSLVNKFNQERQECGCPAIVFECEMYSLGKWSIVLSFEKSSIFFSHEMGQIATLYAGGGFIFFVGSGTCSQMLHFQ